MKMADTPRDNLYGYKEVIESIKQNIDAGISPQSWLAEKLGVSRQAVHFWAGSDGIPAKHVQIVSDLTGLSPMQIRPQDIAISIPGSLFDEIAKQAIARRTTFTARFISILRSGISSSGKRKVG
jgi:hypothetical protein